MGFGDDELALVGAVTAVNHPEVGLVPGAGFTLFEDVVLVGVDLLGCEHFTDSVGTAGEVFEGQLGCIAQQLGFAGLTLLGGGLTG